MMLLNKTGDEQVLDGIMFNPFEVKEIDVKDFDELMFEKVKVAKAKKTSKKKK